MERNSRTTIQGVVTAKNSDKTITVTVSTARNHPLYNKRVGYSKSFHVHDEKNEAKVGDVVTIMACRPLSKTKRFRLVKINQSAANVVSADSVEASLEEKEGVAPTKEAE